MKYFDWNKEKNDELRETRELCFEDILIAIDEGNLLDILEHPNKKKYLHQKILVIKIVEYVYLVPYIEDDEKIFLKTIIPSRKATKKYLFNDKQ